MAKYLTISSVFKVVTSGKNALGLVKLVSASAVSFKNAVASFAIISPENISKMAMMVNTTELTPTQKNENNGHKTIFGFDPTAMAEIFTTRMASLIWRRTKIITQTNATAMNART